MSSGQHNRPDDDASAPCNSYDAERGISLPPLNLNLPPIRSFDLPPTQRRPLPDIHNLPPLEHSISTTTHPPPSTSYYHPTANSTHYPTLYPSSGPDPGLPQLLHYPPADSITSLPPDHGVVPTTQHKKDIKRRTKTGCLTCRKRRIKVRCLHSTHANRPAIPTSFKVFRLLTFPGISQCDESLPACRNCQKSKRGCQYEPIFKQQGQRGASTSHGTSSPAPRSQSPMDDSSAHTTPTLSPQTHRSHALSDVQEQLPPLSSSLIQTSQGHQENTTAKLIDPALGSSSGVIKIETTEARALLPGVVNIRYTLQKRQEPSTPTYAGHDDRNRFQQIQGVIETRAPSGPVNVAPSLRRPLAMHHLYTIGGVDRPMPKASETISPELLKDIEYFYHYEYAHGIDLVLETTWYVSVGLQHLQGDARLNDMFAGMLECFASTKSNDYDAMRMFPCTEARLTWSLMCLPRGAFALAANPSGISPGFDSMVRILVARLAVVEALLTGSTLSPSASLNPAVPASPVAKHREFDFWHHLARFAAHADPADALAQMRRLLDEREGRDVLYSIAIVRHFQDTATASLNEADRVKLNVAQKFVEDEAAGRGTTQVVQRLCGMAVRSWAATGP